ncbi:MAG: TolC family protein [Candidatus Kryptoniota bacterium]
MTEAKAQTQLDSLIDLALQNNPEIKTARYESSAAGTQVSVAGQLPDPQLKISAMNVPSNFILNSDMMTMVPQVTLMQMFPWFGKLAAASDVKKYGYYASKDRLANITLEVVSRIKKTYADIYQAQKTIAYLEYKRTLLNGVVKAAEQLFAVGQVPQQDVFRATAELTMVQSDIINANAMLKQKYADLTALIGKSELIAPQIDTLKLIKLQPLNDLMAELFRGNPYLLQVNNLKRAAEAQTIFARKDAVPDLTFGVSYGYRGALAPDGTKAPNMMNFEIGLSVPVFFGAKQEKMIDEADFMKKAAEQDYDVTALSLQNQLRSIYAEAEAMSRLIPLYSKELVPQYEATYNSSLSSYSVGKTTFAMLIDNLTTLINTKIDLLKIESNYFSATAEISKLVGENSLKYRGE